MDVIVWKMPTTSAHNEVRREHGRNQQQPRDQRVPGQVDDHLLSHALTILRS